MKIVVAALIGIAVTIGAEYGLYRMTMLGCAATFQVSECRTILLFVPRRSM